MNCQNLKIKYEELLNLQNEFQIVNAEFRKMKPSTVAERRVVSDELQRRQEDITKFIQENFDLILWREKMKKRVIDLDYDVPY